MVDRNPEICIIAALSENRVIGKDGQIPWRIPEDMKHFRELTTPHPIIVGRKTYESFPKRPLPNRVNIILSREYTKTTDSDVDLDVYHYKHLGSAIALGASLDHEKVFIVGGGQIYNQTIDLADRLFLTLVRGDFDGDTYFPDYSAFRKIVSEEQRESNGLRYKFVELTR
jgi:dihydrofolate reductase